MNLPRLIPNTALEAYLSDRQEQFQKLSKLFSTYGAFYRTAAINAQANAYGEVLELAGDKRDSELKDYLRKKIDEPGIFSYNIGLVYRDVLHFLEHKKSLLPKSILDLPEFIEKEREQRKHAALKKAEVESLQRQAEAEKRREEAAQRARTQKLNELGLDEDIIEGLRRVAKD